MPLGAGGPGWRTRAQGRLKLIRLHNCTLKHFQAELTDPHLPMTSPLPLPVSTGPVELLSSRVRAASPARIKYSRVKLRKYVIDGV